MRPKSIVQFDYVYLTSVAIGLAGAMLTWRERTAAVQVQRAIAQIGEWYPFAVYGAIFAVTLLLWYLVSRRASLVAKWLLVAMVALGSMSTLWTLLVGDIVAQGLGGVIGVMVSLLYIVAAVLLFRPDARAWLGEDVGEGASA